MEETKSGKTYTMNIKQAVTLVQEKISDYRTGLEGITLTNPDIELDPVLVEGETSKGFMVQMFVDPRIPARVLLDFDYPIYKVLGEEPPREMWNRLAMTLGLDDIISVDL